MKFTSTRSVLFCFVFIIYSHFAGAQSQDAGAYLSSLNEKQQEVSEDAMSYVSAVAHGKSARKIEKRRNELLNSIVQARAMAKNMRPFDGDTSLKSAAYNHYNLTYLVIKEDYGKIVDMEEIAEQSYDNMEAYLAAQEKANEKLDQANEEVEKAYKDFAARHNIHLVEDQSKLSKMTDLVNKMEKYYHGIFLIYFKSFIDEKHLLEAMNKKDMNGMEQNKGALIKSSSEGLPLLAKIPSFDGDGSINISCRQLLQFYNTEAKDKMQAISDYYMKQETFDKLQKAVDSKSPSERSQQDIDKYNKGVKDINLAVQVYNKNNKELNDLRNKFNDDWNNTVEVFFSKHTPRYRK